MDAPDSPDAPHVPHALIRSAAEGIARRLAGEKGPQGALRSVVHMVDSDEAEPAVAAPRQVGLRDSTWIRACGCRMIRPGNGRLTRAWTLRG
ncbi:hypothetical protein SNL152K_6739 [Streptomyces sp. NL15-2K]|nr:hypothetical protein SNL152K_6739 [Streptomyces sp. NL15-2K]